MTPCNSHFIPELYLPNTVFILNLSVADPGFPVEGGVDPRGGYISKILYVKTKESGPLGGGVRRTRPLLIRQCLLLISETNWKLKQHDNPAD